MMGKGISASFGAETTGDFLLELGHAKVAFGLVPEHRHFSRNPKWDPSDFGCKKLGGGHCLQRPMFVLRPSRRALRSSLTLPRFPVFLRGG